MKTFMVRYTISSAAQANANADLVHAVFEELRSLAPEGVRYATYRLPDGLTFVHIVTVASQDENPIPKLAAFKAFQKELKDRCAAPPVAVELLPVDSYAR